VKVGDLVKCRWIKDSSGVQRLGIITRDVTRLYSFTEIARAGGSLIFNVDFFDDSPEPLEFMDSELDIVRKSR